MLKIFSDRRYLAPETPHLVTLAPFWGPLPEDPRDPTSGRYDGFLARGRSLLELVSLDQAEAAILPMAWEHVVGRPRAEELAHVFAVTARKAGTPVVILFVSDSEAPVRCEGALVLRTSLRRSRVRQGERALPAFAEDILARHRGGRLDPRPKRERPLVGFCGYAPGGHGGVRLQRLLRRGEAAGGSLRLDACRLLERHASVDTSFVLRDAFWGGAVLVSGELDFDRMSRVRAQYVENLLTSDYVLCSRGGGNFSYRLYETLAAGRIPLFVDTDCVLPFEREIDWRSLCVWVDSSELERIGDVLTAFHASLTAGEFLERQLECRRIWETYLSPEGFHAHLALALESAASG